MTGYPKGRWWVGEKETGASVWTRKLNEGDGGGYYLYGWERGADVITLKELVEASSREERQWPIGKPSVYAHLADIPVPGPVRTANAHLQELEVARLIFKDMRERFGEFAEWITYDTFGQAVWFHDKVINES